jgi:two-component system LytT family sensor kinase
MRDLRKIYHWDRRFFLTRGFWIFNFLAWVVFALMHSIIGAMSGGNFSGHIQSIASTASFGCLYCYGLHLLAAKSRWFERHPVSRIPLICMFAFLFAAVATFMQDAQLIVQIPVTCSPTSQPPESFLCGAVSNAFFESLSAVLIWLLLYVYIEYERRNASSREVSRKQTITAVLILIALKILDGAVSSFAWIRLIDSLVVLYFVIHLFFTIVFARIILLVRPREKLLGSQLIPLLPTFFMLVFCLGVVEIIVGNVVFRAVRYGLTDYHSDQPNIVLYILLGGSDGMWRSAGDLSGPLQAACRDICVVALFLLYSRLTTLINSFQSTEVIKVDFNHSLLFWAYNLNGWFVIAACLYFSDILGLGVVASAMPAAFSISFFISGVFMGGMIRSTLRNRPFDDAAFIPFVSRLIFISLVLGIMQTCVIWFCNQIYIYLAMNKEDPFRYAYFISYTYHFLYSCVLCTLSFALWSLAYEISVSQRGKVNAKLKQLQLENNIKQLQLNAMAGKIDPHFIFNALNNIRYLVNKDAERARESLLVLSDILRNPIAKSTADKILLSEEMALVKNYMILSKIQFEQRLAYEEEIDTNAVCALIPPMMLQILVENSIKHGISQLPDGGTLRLNIACKDQQLVCHVINTGELLDQSTVAGFGLGTKNIRERLLLLYGVSAHFSLVQDQTNVIAELRLPLEYSL